MCYKMRGVYSYGISILVIIYLSIPNALTGRSLSNLQLRQSMVLLDITPIYPDAIRPWLQKTGTSFLSIGLVMPNKRILTLANEMRYASLIEISHYNSYTKTLAKIERIDFESNLALLSVAKDSFFRKLHPLRLVKRDASPGAFVNGSAH